MANDAFEILIKETVIYNQKEKENTLIYVISIILYSLEYQTTSPLVIQVTEILVYIRMLRMTWTEHVKNEQVLREIQTKKTLRLESKK